MRVISLLVFMQSASSNNNENTSSGRVIIGAVRKQNRNYEDGARSTSIFARPIIPPLTTAESATHFVRGSDSSTFSPNSYTFSVELKSSDRNSNVNRRTNKNYVKPSILSAVSNANVIRTSGNLSGNLSEAFAATTTTNANVMTPSPSQTISVFRNGPKNSVFQSGPKNYLSFSPGSYTFNVNLKSNDRGAHKKKNYLS